MYIEIICGTYGYRPNPNEPRVIRKDSHSPAFELDDAEARRLIRLGVAKVVATSQQPEKVNDNPSEISEEEILDMGFNDMRKLANQYGLDTKGTKEELQERLIEAFVKGSDNTSDEMRNDEADDDGSSDMPPKFNAQDPV